MAHADVACYHQPARSDAESSTQRRSTPRLAKPRQTQDSVLSCVAGKCAIWNKRQFCSSCVRSLIRNALLNLCERMIVLRYCNVTIAHLKIRRRARQSQIADFTLAIFARPRPADENIACPWTEFPLLMARFGAQFRERTLSVAHHTPPTLRTCVVDNSVDKLAKVRPRDVLFVPIKPCFQRESAPVKICLDSNRSGFTRTQHDRLQLVGDFILRSREEPHRG
jgi:hypothetical protein